MQADNSELGAARGLVTASPDTKDKTQRPPEKTHATADSASGWRPWGLGGSDIGAILGVCAFRSDVDVWLDKVRPQGAASPSTSLPMRLGNFLEPFVVQEYERLTGHATREHVGTLRHPTYPELFGHVDRIVDLKCGPDGAGRAAQSRHLVLECKTCSAFRAHEWGPAWSDQVPAEYLAQCLWYLGLTQYEEAHLAVLLGNSDLRIYRIKRDLDIERHMFELAHRFWHEHVLTRRAPAATTRLQAQSLHPQPVDGRTQAAKSRTVAAVRRKARLEARVAALEQEIKKLRDKIAVAIGDAESLTWEGQTLATWRLCNGPARLDTERLRRERPDVAADYTVKGPATRRLLINTKTLVPTPATGGL